MEKCFTQITKKETEKKINVNIHSICCRRIYDLEGAAAFDHYELTSLYEIG